MVQGIIIPASESKAVVCAEFATLEDYQRLVGGWIEAVDIPVLNATMYVNEEGPLRGLPFNRRATFPLWFHVPATRGRARLVDNAVPVGGGETAGNRTDLSTAVSQLLLGHGEHNVSTREPGGTRWRSEPEPHEDYLEAIIWATVLQEYAPGPQVRERPVDDNYEKQRHSAHSGGHRRNASPMSVSTAFSICGAMTVHARRSAGGSRGRSVGSAKSKHARLCG